MKIDFDMLQKMVDAGATGSVVLAMVREQYDRGAPKRKRDARRIKEKRATRRDNTATPSDIARQGATLDDTPRARLFREGRGALLTMSISASRAGGLIAQWLKITNDDEQLVLATILKAQSLAVADAPSWILATLKGKTNGNATGADRSAAASGRQQSSSDAIIAGVAAASERRARERQQRQLSENPAPARQPDPDFFGTGDR